MIYTIKSGDIVAEINSYGAELSSVKLAGTELIWQSPSDEFWSKHAPLLFPVCGKLKDNAYTYKGKKYDMKGHGFISRCEFKPLSECEDTITLYTESNEDTLKIYPFSFRFTIEYKATEKGISSRARIENLGDCAMPYMFGWHPGFVLMCDENADINDYRFTFENKPEFVTWSQLQHVSFINPNKKAYKTTDGAYVFSEDEIYANDTMIFSNVGTRATLSSPKSSYKIDFEWSESTPHICIWKHPDNRTKFICIEPWSSLPSDGEREEDFEVRDMARLNPSDTEEFLFSFEFSL